MLIPLRNVRASHLYAFEPFRAKPSAQQPNPKAVFKSQLIMAPTHADLALVAKTIQEVAVAKWHDKAAEVLTALKGQDKICLHKGDISQPGKPEYAGQYYVSASNEQRFSVYGPNREILTAQDTLRPYSGCWINAKVDIWAMDNNWGKRICATLTGIQFVRHDTAFGGGAAPATAEEFDIINAEAADAPAPAGDPTGGLIG